MNDTEKTRSYKNDEFKINCIFEENGKQLSTIIEEAFRNYYNSKINT